MLELMVNGEKKQLAGPTHLSSALPEWGFEDSFFAVAVNGTFVPRSQYDQFLLEGEERLDILRPQRGG